MPGCSRCSAAGLWVAEEGEGVTLGLVLEPSGRLGPLDRDVHFTAWCQEAELLAGSLVVSGCQWRNKGEEACLSAAGWSSSLGAAPGV